MTRIAYLLLAHKEPLAVAAQARKLVGGGDFVAIHYDARAPRREYAQLRAALAGVAGAVFVRRRVRCGWGEWSLVEATLRLARTALRSFADATHFYLISGDCAPIKPATSIRAALERRDVDHIESAEFFTSLWIKGGIRDERVTQWHIFNERKYKRLFYANIAVQKWLGLRRKIPKDVQLHIGAQWWCLRRQTLEGIIKLSRARPDIIRFFRYSWIPDETFFQTVIRLVAPQKEIEMAPPTLVMFGQYGLPVTFYNDHQALLRAQHQFFARKISPQAAQLKKWLDEVYDGPEPDPCSYDNGPRLYAFIAAKKRMSLRYASRFWERPPPASVPRDLRIIICKKRIIGKRLAGRISENSGYRSVQYVFDEEDAQLPDLGGLQHSLKKRLYHPAAFMDVLLDYWRAAPLVICLDPAQLDMLHMLYAQRGQGHYALRLLHVQCQFDDAALYAHARYNGLVHPETKDAQIKPLFSMMRQTIDLEARLLMQAGFSGLSVLRESEGQSTKNIAQLAAFLDIPEDDAQEILRNDFLFND